MDIRKVFIDGERFLMPWKIIKRGNQWVKIKADSGKVISHHASKAKALASIADRRKVVAMRLSYHLESGGKLTKRKRKSK